MKKDNTPFYSALLFLVWPLLSLVSAFKNFRHSWAKNVLWAFVAFYGFTFAIGSESKGTDILGYINEFQTLYSVTLDFSSAVEYFLDSGEIDLLQTFIAVILSRFTDNPAVLTLTYGIIFGFFFSRNMWFVLEHLEGKIKPIAILLFICFFLVVPIWDINGFRFWTAAHVFVYGLLPYLFEGKNEKVIISSLSILVHFSFLIPVSILFFYILLGNRVWLYFALFLTTFFISEIGLTFFNNFIENYAPEILQERTSGYRGKNYVESYREGSVNEGRVWYAVWYHRALNWSIMGFLVVLFFKGRAFFERNKRWMSLFSFTLFLYGVANLFSSLPSGGRFVSVANLSALALILLYIQNTEHELAMRRLIATTIPALLLYVVVSIRIGLLSMSATAFLGNPIIALFLTEEHISLNDLLRRIL